MSSETSSVEVELYNALNSKNIHLSRDFFIELLRAHGLTIPESMCRESESESESESEELWKIVQRAFVHSSYCRTPKKPRRDESYTEPKPTKDTIDFFDNDSQILEWFGDGIIQAFMSFYLMRRYWGRCDEGFLSTARSKLVRTASLSHLAQCLGLNPYIVISTATEEVANGRNNPKILEDCFEALIGAITLIYSDKKYHSFDEVTSIGYCPIGFKHACIFLQSVFEKYIDISETISKNTNYKHQLMCYFQKNFGGTYPKYKQILMDTTKEKYFKMAVIHPDDITKDTDSKIRTIGIGIARNKKEAEQNSAKEALRYFGVLEE